MSQHRQFKLVSTGLCIAVVAAFVGLRCDSVLPDKYQEKRFDIAAIDDQACGLLSRGNDSTLVVQSRRLVDLVDSAAAATSSDNQIIATRFAAVTDSLPQLVRDSLTLVRYPDGAQVSYARFTVTTGQPGGIYLYVSLRYNEQNIGERVSVGFVRSDTSEVDLSGDMPWEAVSGCTQVVPGTLTVMPTILARLDLQLDPGTYVVRFVVSSASTVGPFKVAILSL
jgi:hypothetical protein